MLRWGLIMRTVDLIQRKRDGEELAAEEITALVEGYVAGRVPDYQMSAFLMAVNVAPIISTPCFCRMPLSQSWQVTVLCFWSRPSQ